jgi:hypothetical protein
MRDGCYGKHKRCREEVSGCRRKQEWGGGEDIMEEKSSGNPNTYIKIYYHGYCEKG